MREETVVYPADRDTSSLRVLSLRRNFSWAFVGNVIYAACQWGLLAALAKMGSVVSVGQFTLGLAVAAPVFMLANLQLRAVQATDAVEEYDFRDYFGLRLLTTSLALVAVLAVGTWVGYAPQTAFVVLLVGSAKGVESLSDVAYGLFQQRERMDWVAQSLMIRGPLSLVAFIVILATTESLGWAVAGIVGSWGVVLIAHDFPRCRQAGASLWPRWHTATLRRLTVLALPLGGVMMFLALNTNIPRYLIEHELGTHELGIYSALAYLMVAGTTVVSALGQSASPRLSQYHAVGQKGAFRSLLFRLIWLGLGLGIAGVLVAAVAGEELLRLLYTQEYANHEKLFLAMMAVAAASYVLAFVGYGMTAARQFRVQLPIFSTAALATLAVGWWAIPHYGLFGAVLALLSSIVVRAVGGGAVIFHVLRRSSEDPAGSTVRQHT